MVAARCTAAKSDRSRWSAADGACPSGTAATLVAWGLPGLSHRMCHLEPAPLKQLSDWVGSYREFWEESFERLDELLQDLQAPSTEAGRVRGDDSDQGGTK